MTDNDNLKAIIAEIKATIDSWKPLPAKPSEFIDPKTFTGIPNPGVHLAKISNEIKVHTDNAEDLSITEKDLIPPEGRIGIGREFLIMLQNRLGAFKKLLDEEAAKEQKE